MRSGPLALLDDVKAALASGSLSSLSEWADVLGWIESEAAAPGLDEGAHSPPDPDRLLSVREVRALTGLGRTTLWALERRGEFPRRVQVSAGRVAFRQAEVARWIEARRPR